MSKTNSSTLITQIHNFCIWFFQNSFAFFVVAPTKKTFFWLEVEEWVNTKTLKKISTFKLLFFILHFCIWWIKTFFLSIEEVQPVSPRILSLVEKTSHSKQKILTTLKLRLTKRANPSFQNCFDTWCHNCTVYLSGGCLCPQTI